MVGNFGRNRANSSISARVSKLRTKLKPLFVQLGMTMAALVYMTAGALVFMWIERSRPDDGNQVRDCPQASPITWQQRDCLQMVLNASRFVRNLTTDVLSSASDCINPQQLNGTIAPLWTFANSLMFTYTVMTTIGYGNIAPVTVVGRLFCIVYGLVGIPLTMMAIANIGKFFSDVGKHAGVSASRQLRRWRRRRRRRHNRAAAAAAAAVGLSLCGSDAHSRILVLQSPLHSISDRGRDNTKETIVSNQFVHEEVDVDLEEGDMQLQQMAQEGHGRKGGDIEDCSSVTSDDLETDDELSTELQTGIIVGCFVVYVALGAAVIPLYEDDMDFFSAIYFNFVTLTTVGLGDIIPSRTEFMWFTLAYITAGLALTTVAIEVASEHLQKIHFVGRKLRNAGNVAIWFGGQKLTVKNLMQNVGETYGIKELEDPNLSANFINNLVDAAIKRDEDPNFQNQLEPILEIVPSEITCSLSPESFTEEYATLCHHEVTSLEPAVMPACTALPTFTITGTPARKPKAEKHKVDPKKRYELYQKQWAKYNANFLEAKKFDDVKKADGGSRNQVPFYWRLPFFSFRECKKCQNLPFYWRCRSIGASPAHSGTSTPQSRSRSNTAASVKAAAERVKEHRKDHDDSISQSSSSTTSTRAGGGIMSPQHLTPGAKLPVVRKSPVTHSRNAADGDSKGKKVRADKNGRNVKKSGADSGWKR